MSDRFPPPRSQGNDRFGPPPSYDRDDRDRRGDRDRNLDGAKGRGGDQKFPPPRRDRDPSFRPPPRRRSPPRERSFSPLRDGEPAAIPISQWPRKLNNWDVKPLGFDEMNAEEVKETGLFQLPCHGLRGAPMASVAIMAQNAIASMNGAELNPSLLNPTLARQQRRIFVANIPLDAEESTIANYFNRTLGRQGIVNGDCVTAVEINHEKNFAFVEFRNPEEATMGMTLDGSHFEGNTVKIRRPKDYISPGSAIDGMPLNIQSMETIVPDTPNKVFIGGLPMYLNESQVAELLKAFGALKSFALVKDGLTGQSKGMAFCEFENSDVTDIACAGLNGMELGDKKLRVQRANTGAKESVVVSSVLPMQIMMAAGKGDEPPTTIVQLYNLIGPDDLEEDEDYEELVIDIQEEMERYGPIEKLVIPRPIDGEPVRGVGKVLIRFKALDSAKAAKLGLAGRQYSDRTVVTSYFPIERFETKFY